jgi:hypothetical protein
MLFKNPVRTSKRTPHFTITKINWLTLFKEIILDYNEKHKQTYEHKMQCCGLLKQVGHTLFTTWLQRVNIPGGIKNKTSDLIRQGHLGMD